MVWLLQWGVYGGVALVMVATVRMLVLREMRSVTSMSGMLDTYDDIQCQLREMPGQNIRIACGASESTSTEREYLLAALAEEDRVWLREHGWNGR